MSSMSAMSSMSKQNCNRLRVFFRPLVVVRMMKCFVDMAYTIDVRDSLDDPDLKTGPKKVPPWFRTTPRSYLYKMRAQINSPVCGFQDK